MIEFKDKYNIIINGHDVKETELRILIGIGQELLERNKNNYDIYNILSEIKDVIKWEL